MHIPTALTRPRAVLDKEETGGAIIEVRGLVGPVDEDGGTLERGCWVVKVALPLRPEG